MAEITFREDIAMEQEIGRRHVLAEKGFRYQAAKNGTVRLYWKDKLVKMLSEKEGDHFLERMAQAQDEQQRQLVMAKLTGNFKRGSEREGKDRGRG